MKKTVLGLIAFILIIASAAVSYAGEYTISDHWWSEDYEGGTLAIEWEKCEGTTRYHVQVYRKSLSSTRSGVGDRVYSKIVSGKKLDISEVIYKKGTGSYSYTITPRKSEDSLDDMAVSYETFDAESDFVARVRKRIDSQGSPEDQETAVSNGWAKVPSGWAYLEGGVKVTNAWRLIDGFWYYFNGNGDMLRGWQWINRRCYYLNEVANAGGYPEGACWMNGSTPDGYTVNANGEWTVGNVPQTR